MKETENIFSPTTPEQSQDTGAQKQPNFTDFQKQVADRVNKLYIGIEPESVEEAKFEPYGGFDENSINVLTVEDLHQWNAVTNFEKEAIEKQGYDPRELEELMRDFHRYREAIESQVDDLPDDRAVWNARKMFAHLLADIIEALPQTVISRNEKTENIPDIDEIRARHNVEIEQRMKKFSGGHPESTDEDFTKPIKPQTSALDSDFIH